MDLFYFLTLVLCGFFGNLIYGLELKNGAYEDLVIKVAENVPETDCKNILNNLETTLISASQFLFSALDSRAYLRSATVVLPSSWPDFCAPTSVSAASGDLSDITVLPSDPIRGNIYTQQSLGCGQPGDQIYLGYETLQNKNPTLARSLVKEFAMYRYGVFEEQGYFNDPVYPKCFHDDIQNKVKVTGCSELQINDNGICNSDNNNNNNVLYNVTKMIHPDARSSIMFAAEAPSVSMFCDDGNHDRFAPTKHNLICQRRSVLDVILKHQDFVGNNDLNSFSNSQIADTAPIIVYKKQNLTRFVFLIENNKDMLQRESWSFLRLALRFWAKYVVRDNTELGLVLASNNPSGTFKIHSIKNGAAGKFVTSHRDNFYSALPYAPSESIQPGCLHCSLRVAMDMLTERTRTHGPANNVIVVIAPGMLLDDQIRSVVDNLKNNKIRVATINYPDIVRPNTLRYLSEQTNGIDYSVFEKKSNVEQTMLTTYFELHNILRDLVYQFYSGNQAELPIEIHRREITDKTGRPLVSGTFILDPSMTEPAEFNFFTYNNYLPLFKGLKLTSPNNHVYDTRVDIFIDFKMITLNANLSESGTWTYNVEPYTGNPQPHYLQVMATPNSAYVPVVRTSFKIRQFGAGLYVLLAEAKYGDLPILGAKVEVSIYKLGVNDTIPQKSIIYLLDSGSGDPDITKGDGIYTRYFSPEESGLYTFEAVVTNNDNTAYTWSISKYIDENKPCCGSAIKSNGAQQLSPFQRFLPKQTLMVTIEDIKAQFERPMQVGRIGDLRVEIYPDDMKAKLTWSAPDMGGNRVSRYEIKYSNNVLDILDKFETATNLWDTNNNGPYPMDPGSETTYIIDMAQNKELLDKPLYFAVKSYGILGTDLTGPVSNYVRMVVPSPPPPPTVAVTNSPNAIWPDHVHPVGLDTIGPKIAKSMSIGIELILPVVIGVILLVVLLIVYCYFCVVRKKANTNHKSAKENALKKDNLNSTITIVPSSPQHHNNSSSSPQHHNNTYQSAEIPDPHHQVGVPVSNYAYEDETKKRYSLVNQQEQQLIEELKQQQQLQQQHHQRDNNLPPAYSGLSVISANTINRNGQPLSPYNSWSASQLLHEHERRYSPMENMMNEEPALMTHQEVMAQMDHLSINGQNIVEHVNVNQMVEQYPPPVPPLPAFNNGGYPVNYAIYGVHQGPHPQQQQQQQQNNQIYQSMPRTDQAVQFNQSLQGSMSSVNSGEKKRRNVTMV